MDIIVELQNIVDRKVVGRDTIVLEAGCGSTSHLVFPEEVYMVGIDISQTQLERNASLDEKILGDIQYFNFQPLSYDIIVCWDVLEHLPNPKMALQRFVGAVKDEGLIVLKLPNVISLKGIVTKYLPYPVRVIFYRYLLGNKEAGKEDTAPFRTYLRFSIAPSNIIKYMMENGLSVAYFNTYDVLSSAWFQRNKVVWTLYRLLSGLLKFITFGKFGDSEFIVVFQKIT